MHCGFTSDMKWTDGEGEIHTIELDLDLTIAEILASNIDIASRLMIGEKGIREEIFRLVTEQILPKIIEDADLNFQQPEGHMHVDAHSKIHSQAEVGIPTRPDTSLRIRDRMRIIFDIRTSCPVNAIQAFYANRGGVASDIANEIVKLLKKGVLKVHDKETESTWSVSGNRLQSFDHNIQKSSVDEN